MRKIWILLAAVLWLAGQEGPALSQTLGPAVLDINNSYTGARLTSDGLGTYSDSSLDPNEPCVSVNVTSNGIFYAKMDFNAAVYPSDCDSSTLITSGAKIRSFNLTLSDSTDCQTLLGPTAPTPCTINVGPGSYANKIFAGTLFNRGAQGTLVEFIFERNDKYYQLKTNSPAGISGTGSTRTATYSGDATLYLVPPSVKTSHRLAARSSFHSSSRRPLSERLWRPATKTGIRCHETGESACVYYGINSTKVRLTCPPPE